MASLQIDESSLPSLTGKVAVITGEPREFFISAVS